MWRQLLNNTTLKLKVSSSENGAGALFDICSLGVVEESWSEDGRYGVPQLASSAF